MATISHKGNFIVSLLNPKGNTVTDHEQKANLLWTSFRERLGISEYTNMIYDLSSLLTFHDLTTLDDDFREDEIDMVIKNRPSNHAPGPDVFNGTFIKKCWPIVKDDFIRLFKDFSSQNIDLRSINSSVIALIPKKDNPERVDDYGPSLS